MMYKIVAVFFIIGEKIYSFDLQIWRCVFYSRRKDIQIWCTNLLVYFYSRRKDIQLWCTNLLVCFYSRRKDIQLWRINLLVCFLYSEKRYTVMMYKFVGVFFIVGEKIYSYDVQIWWCDFIVGEKIYSYEVQHCSGVFHSRRKDIQLWYANLLLCFLYSEKSYTVMMYKSVDVFL